MNCNASNEAGLSGAEADTCGGIVAGRDRTRPRAPNLVILSSRRSHGVHRDELREPRDGGLPRVGRAQRWGTEAACQRRRRQIRLRRPAGSLASRGVVS
jgi:hypothetical protein